MRTTRFLGDQYFDQISFIFGFILYSKVSTEVKQKKKENLQIFRLIDEKKKFRVQFFALGNTSGINFALKF